MGHADRASLEEALTLAQELCTQANQCVKEKQNSDSLEWIQANVQCDGLAEVCFRLSRFFVFLHIQNKSVYVILYYMSK